jgi:benzodiazapine receptor
MNKSIPIIVSIVIAQIAGIIGSIFTSSSVDTWYTTLVKPVFNPPSWVFAPVWITLYTLMGIAAYIIWKKQTANKKALYFYGTQLVLNSLWSFLFFGAQNPGYAFVGILILLVFILETTRQFYKLDTTAGLLMLPYIAWVSFATILNYAIWQLN